MSGDAKTIVLVGHCGPDMFMLKSAIKRAVPEAAREPVNDAQTLETYLNDGALLLVNRVLDGKFDTGGDSESGIELIGSIAGRDGNSPNNQPAMILISNYEESQQEAVAAGAIPGFGKSDLYEQSTTDILRKAAGG